MLKIRELWSLIKSRLWPKKQGTKPFRLVQLEDSPEKHCANVIYLIGENGKYWFVELSCPCGCGEVIKLKLFGKSPVWSANIERKGEITLYPSVWRTRGCRSHFFIRQSCIYWTKNTNLNSH